MPDREIIEHAGQVVAVVLRDALASPGVNFYSPEDFPFQMGVLVHAKATRIRPHLHTHNERTIHTCQEMLHVVRGRVQVDLYNDDGEYLDVVELSAGDTILLASGGHGLHILEDTKIVEVKQGPYLGVEKEKTFLPERLRQTGGRAEGPNSEKE